MKAYFFTTPKGDEMAVLPAADFRAMEAAMEDLADAEAVRSFERILAAGEEELIPAEFVNRIIDGENKVCVWRSYRGISARDLAAATDLSAPYISEIESGKKDGSVSAMKKIAEALRVDLDDIV